MSDAEILCIVFEIINDIPGLKNKNFIIHINHTLLIQSILLHCGIKEKHEEVYNALSQFRVNNYKPICQIFVFIMFLL